MNHEELRVLTQKESQNIANELTALGERMRINSENLSRLKCVEQKVDILVPEQPEIRSEIEFDHIGRFYSPQMLKSHWNEYLKANVKGFNDGSFEVTTEPRLDGSTKTQQNFLLPEVKSYYVEQTVTLLPPFSWSAGKHVGGKLGMGLGSFEPVFGGSTSKGGGSCRFGFRKDKCMLYAYHHDRPTVYGEDFDLGPLIVGEPTRMAMEVGVNSAFDANDGWLKGWRNGELVVDERNMRWQTARSVPRKGVRDLTVSFLWFSHFHGGNDTQWSPAHPNTFKFENIIHM